MPVQADGSIMPRGLFQANKAVVQISSFQMLGDSQDSNGSAGDIFAASFQDVDMLHARLN